MHFCWIFTLIRHCTWLHCKIQIGFCWFWSTGLHVNRHAIPLSPAKVNFTFTFPFCNSLLDGHVARPQQLSLILMSCLLWNSILPGDEVPIKDAATTGAEKTDGESSHFNKKKSDSDIYCCCAFAVCFPSLTAFLLCCCYCCGSLALDCLNLAQC